MSYLPVFETHHFHGMNSYAFLVHGMGPAVGGQGFAMDPDSERCSSNIVIEKNDIHNIRCWNKEVPGQFVIICDFQR